MDENIKLLLEEWNELKTILEQLFKKRDSKNTLEAMKKGIDLYCKFLFWTNDQPEQQIEPNVPLLLDYKPVNIEERLAFIYSRPNAYPSFRQLAELMVEQEKLYVKKNIIKKASKHNNC